jgi:transcriptional regulator with XRE-family HTH domain
MRRSTDRFVVTTDLCARLRELRRRAGLTQVQLARAMGYPGKRAGAIVAKFEIGRLRQPTIGFVADYLRACRAGFADITDVLNRYTDKPTVTEQTVDRALARMAEHLPVRVAKAIANYDIAVEVERAKHAKPKVDPLKRLARARAAGAAQFRREVVSKMLADAVNHAGVRQTMTVVAHLSDYGQKVFGILYRTRGRKPSTRERLLAEAESWLVGQDVLPQEAIRYIGDAVRRLYDRMELEGDLDWQPDWTVDDLDTILLTPARRRELREDQRFEARGRRDEYDDARRRLIEAVWREVQPLLIEAGVPEVRWPQYRALVPRVAHIVDHWEPGSSEARAEIEALVAEPSTARFGLDSDLLRRLADVALARYAELRKSLPPDPRGWTR